MTTTATSQVLNGQYELAASSPVENRPNDTFIVDGDTPNLPSTTQSVSQPKINESNLDLREDESIKRAQKFEVLFNGLGQDALVDGDRRGRYQSSFEFSLMPAIESTVRHQSSAPGSSGSGQTVPEVKPGIRISTDYAKKNALVPGGVPVVQTIGIRGRIINFCGLFLGTENVPGLDGRAYQFESGPYEYNSYEVAQYFQLNVADSGREILVSVESDGVLLEYEGTIKNLRLYAAREDRTYYCFDLLQTQYRISDEYRLLNAIAKEENFQREVAALVETIRQIDPEEYDRVLAALPPDVARSLENYELARFVRLNGPNTENLDWLADMAADLVIFFYAPTNPVRQQSLDVLFPGNEEIREVEQPAATIQRNSPSASASDPSWLEKVGNFFIPPAAANTSSLSQIYNDVPDSAYVPIDVESDEWSEAYKESSVLYSNQPEVTQFEFFAGGAQGVQEIPVETVYATELSGAANTNVSSNGEVGYSSITVPVGELSPLTSSHELFQVGQETVAATSNVTTPELEQALNNKYGYAGNFIRFSKGLTSTAVNVILP